MLKLTLSPPGKEDQTLIRYMSDNCDTISDGVLAQLPSELLMLVCDVIGERALVMLGRWLRLQEPPSTEQQCAMLQVRDY